MNVLRNPLKKKDTQLVCNFPYNKQLSYPFLYRFCISKKNKNKKNERKKKRKGKRKNSNVHPPDQSGVKGLIQGALLLDLEVLLCRRPHVHGKPGRQTHTSINLFVFFCKKQEENINTCSMVKCIIKLLDHCLQVI